MQEVLRVPFEQNKKRKKEDKKWNQGTTDMN